MVVIRYHVAVQRRALRIWLANHRELVAVSLLVSRAASCSHYLQRWRHWAAR